LLGTASYSNDAGTLDGLDSTVFTLTSSFNAQTASFTAFTASINTFTSSATTRLGALEAATASLYSATSSFSGRVGALEAATSSLYSYTSSLNNKTASFATTGSNTFIGTQTISGSVLQSGSFTSTGTLTAQTLVVQTITSSVIYSSGSNIFGNVIGNTQTFTGSVLITGSLTISTGGNASAPTIFGSTIACSPIGCFATSCATSFIGGTMSGTTIYGSTAVCSPVGKFTTCLDLGGALTGTSATFYSASGTIMNIYSDNTTTDNILLVRGNTGSTIGLVVKGSGNVGIGTTSITQPSAGATTLRIVGTVTNKAGSIYLDSSDSSVSTYIYSDATNGLSINTSTVHPITFRTSDTTRLTIASTGAACFACELTAKTLGTNDLILNNLNYECANYVDGTRGSWLIQEGACDLFIINQVSCKKYKFNLIEIK
jgi:hypothetical protein